MTRWVFLHDGPHEGPKFVEFVQTMASVLKAEVNETRMGFKLRSKKDRAQYQLVSAPRTGLWDKLPRPEGLTDVASLHLEGIPADLGPEGTDRLFNLITRTIGDNLGNLLLAQNMLDDHEVDFWGIAGRAELVRPSMKDVLLRCLNTYPRYVYDDWDRPRRTVSENARRSLGAGVEPDMNKRENVWAQITGVDSAILGDHLDLLVEELLGKAPIVFVSHRQVRSAVRPILKLLNDHLAEYENLYVLFPDEELLPPSFAELRKKHPAAARELLTGEIEVAGWFKRVLDDRGVAVDVPAVRLSLPSTRFIVADDGVLMDGVLAIGRSADETLWLTDGRTIQRLIAPDYIEGQKWEWEQADPILSLEVAGQLVICTTRSRRVALSLGEGDHLTVLDDNLAISRPFASLDNDHRIVATSPGRKIEVHDFSESGPQRILSLVPGQPLEEPEDGVTPDPSRPSRDTFGTGFKVLDLSDESILWIVSGIGPPRGVQIGPLLDGENSDFEIRLTGQGPGGPIYSEHLNHNEQGLLVSGNNRRHLEITDFDLEGLNFKVQQRAHQFFGRGKNPSNKVLQSRFRNESIFVLMSSCELFEISSQEGFFNSCVKRKSSRHLKSIQGWLAQAIDCGSKGMFLLTSRRQLIRDRRAWS